MDVVAGEVTKCAQALAKALELFLVGKGAGEQQVGDFLIAKAVFCLGVIHQVVDAVAAQAQAALVGDDATVDPVVAVDVGDACKTRDDAGAVGIAQAALDVMLLEERFVVGRIGKTVVQALTVLVDLAACLVVEHQAAQIVVEAVVNLFSVICHG